MTITKEFANELESCNILISSSERMEEPVESSVAELIGRIEAVLADESDELVALRAELEALRAIEAERDEALREAELTLGQLHESQKELQHYYLLCRQQAEIMSAAEDLQARSFALLANAYT